MKWFLNRDNKVPLYLQLKDLIKYHISTGAIQFKEQLPPVHGLAAELGVNFETVRKAYKELEREGLVSTDRGVGTFVNVAAEVPATAASPGRDHKSGLKDTVVHGIRELLKAGTSKREIETLVKETITRTSHENRRKLVLFVECNTLQAEDISRLLGEQLRLNVKPILLKDLKTELKLLDQSPASLEAIITTGFHINEVRTAVGSRRLHTDFVIANMSPETRRKLDPYHETARFGFVCRDDDSKYYKDILKAELEIKSDIPSCTIHEKAKVTELLSSVDVILATPSVFETLKKIVGNKLPIFNVQDRVDPMSLRMLEERMRSL